MEHLRCTKKFVFDIVIFHPLTLEYSETPSTC